jgi:hypothetical protein
MGLITMTIAEIRRPAEGKDRGNIIGTDGTRLGCFREKLGLIQIGATYELEITDGQYQNVKSVKQVAATCAPTQQQPASTPRTHVNGNGGGNSYRRTDPVDSERMFVCATLGAFIKAGKIEPELGKVVNAIQVLRTAYQRTLGADSE